MLKTRPRAFYFPRFPCVLALCSALLLTACRWSGDRLYSGRVLRAAFLPDQCIVIHSRASRSARARSVFDILAEISERSSAARADPLMAAMLNHL